MLFSRKSRGWATQCWECVKTKSDGSQGDSRKKAIVLVIDVCIVWGTARAHLCEGKCFVWHARGETKERGAAREEVKQQLDNDRALAKSKTTCNVGRFSGWRKTWLLPTEKLDYFRLPHKKNDNNSEATAHTTDLASNGSHRPWLFLYDGHYHHHAGHRHYATSPSRRTQLRRGRERGRAGAAARGKPSGPLRPRRRYKGLESGCYDDLAHELLMAKTRPAAEVARSARFEADGLEIGAASKVRRAAVLHRDSRRALRVHRLWDLPSLSADGKRKSHSQLYCCTQRLPRCGSCFPS